VRARERAVEACVCARAVDVWRAAPAGFARATAERGPSMEAKCTLPSDAIQPSEFLERRREMGSRGVGRAQQPQPPALEYKGRVSGVDMRRSQLPELQLQLQLAAVAVEARAGEPTPPPTEK